MRKTPKWKVMMQLWLFSKKFKDSDLGMHKGWDISHSRSLSFDAKEQYISLSSQGEWRNKTCVEIYKTKLDLIMGDRDAMRGFSDYEKAMNIRVSKLESNNESHRETQQDAKASFLHWFWTFCGYFGGLYQSCGHWGVKFEMPHFFYVQCGKC